MPKIRKTHNNIQYLTDSESDAFCRALEDRQNGLSYKRRAIGTLLYYTGMRCSDICRLRLDSVDLQRSVIRFVQQKTGNSVEIPLSAIVENAHIRQNKGDRKGSHIFQYRAVSRMAEKNIPTPVISAIVGHTSPKSLDPYLYADMKHIRECALGLEKYPIAEEVFSCA